jgi:hypothetical protein
LAVQLCAKSNYRKQPRIIHPKCFSITLVEVYLVKVVEIIRAGLLGWVNALG